jgi:hypothetical protein
MTKGATAITEMQCIASGMVPAGYDLEPPSIPKACATAFFGHVLREYRIWLYVM